jgi:hypothetical protein
VPQVLVIHSHGGVRLSQVRTYLGEIERAYTALAAVDAAARRALEGVGPPEELAEWARDIDRGLGRAHRFVPPWQRLILASVRLESPGEWKVVGEVADAANATASALDKIATLGSSRRTAAASARSVEAQADVNELERDIVGAVADEELQARLAEARERLATAEARAEAARVKQRQAEAKAEIAIRREALALVREQMQTVRELEEMWPDDPGVIELRKTVTSTVERLFDRPTVRLLTDGATTESGSAQLATGRPMSP